MGSFKTQYLSVTVFSAVTNALMLAPSWYMLQVYDRVLTSHDDNTLLGLSLIVMFVYLIHALLERVRGRVLIEVAEDLDAQVAPRLHRRLLDPQLPAAQRDMQALSELQTVKQFLTGQPMLAFLDAPWAVIYLAVIFLLHPALGWLAVGSTLALVLLAVLNQRLTRAGLDRSREFATRERVWLGNATTAVDSLHAMGMKSAVAGRLGLLRGQHLQSLLEASGRAVNISAAGKWIRSVIQSAGLGAGAWLAIHGEMTSGGIIAASILLGRTLAPIEGVIAAWKQWAEFRKGMASLGQLLGPAQAQAPSVRLGRPVGHLRLEEVSVRLRESGPPTLEGLNLDIPAGTTVAVIGPSGAGKTTLLKTLAGVLRPASGRALLDGGELAVRDAEELGAHLGYLGQDTALLAGKVSENIARFAAVDSEAVIQAARAAGAHEMLVALPQGYETELGNQGAGLSEGQKRRIGLARALYGRPAVVLLDEPGTALDDASAAQLMQTLQQLKAQGVTVVFSTHQPSMLQLADLVLVLVDGRLRLSGKRDEVLARLGQR